MASVVMKKDDEANVVDCAHCEAVIHYLLEELKPMSNEQPYLGLTCPACGKNIFADGTRLLS